MTHHGNKKYFYQDEELRSSRLEELKKYSLRKIKPACKVELNDESTLYQELYACICWELAREIKEMKHFQHFNESSYFKDLPSFYRRLCASYHTWFDTNFHWLELETQKPETFKLFKSLVVRRPPIFMDIFDEFINAYKDVRSRDSDNIMLMINDEAFLHYSIDDMVRQLRKRVEDKLNSLNEQHPDFISKRKSHSHGLSITDIFSKLELIDYHRCKCVTSTTQEADDLFLELYGYEYPNQSSKTKAETKLQTLAVKLYPFLKSHTLISFNG